MTTPRPTIGNGDPPQHSTAARRDSSDSIVVEIGHECMKYNVQKAFLTYYSGYFSKALNGTWKEARDKVVRLADIEPAIFNLFIEWLYTQNLPNLTTLDANEINASNQLWKIKLYAFADRFAVSRLRTALNLEIVKDAAPPHLSMWTYTAIIYAFANLPSTDPLLDLFVDIHYIYLSDKVNNPEARGWLDRLPREFLLHFFKKVGTERRSHRQFRLTKSYAIDFCSYHEHTTDQQKRECAHQTKPQPQLTLLKRGLRQ